MWDSIDQRDLEQYVKAVKELDAFGVDAIVMVCNTIHLFRNLLQKQVGTPIFDLRAEVRRRLLADGVKRITVLGTPNTVRQGLYSFDEFGCLSPPPLCDKELSELSNAIHEFIIGKDKEKQVAVVEAMCKKHLEQGSEKIILGCTELAVMLDKSDLPVMNTIDVLVDAVVDMVLE